MKRRLKGKVQPTLSVKDLLVAEIGGHEVARPADELHASDLTRTDPEFCPRAVVLMRRLGVKPKPIRVEHAMRVTWDDGHDRQWRINNQYLRDYMIGDWRCARCDEAVAWSRYPEEYESSCYPGGHVWQYRETVFRHPSGFTGSLDGVVAFGASRRRMLEVKIVKGEPTKGSQAPNFREIIAPLAEHLVRTRLYLRLIAESEDRRAKMIDTSAAHVLYVSRGHGAKDEHGLVTPFKEFVVERDDASVGRYIKMALAVRAGGEGRTPEGVCASAMCRRAKSCAVVKECFSGKHPADLKWRESK